MKHKSFSSAWLQKSSLLLAKMLAFSCAVYAQPNYISIIGKYGCSGTTANADQALSCTGTPSHSSLSTIYSLVDRYSNPFGYSPTTDQMLYNSQYDASGNLLFSVNSDGIYDYTGALVYQFIYSWLSSPYNGGFYTASPCSYSPTIGVSPEAAASEICIIPKPGGTTNSYYLIFWCSVPDGTTSFFPYQGKTGGKYFLRAMEVDVSGSAGSYSYSCPQDVFLCPGTNCSAYDYGYFPPNGSGVFDVAANSPNCDNSVDIYTVRPDYDALSGNYFGTV